MPFLQNLTDLGALMYSQYGSPATCGPDAAVHTPRPAKTLQLLEYLRRRSLVKTRRPPECVGLDRGFNGYDFGLHLCATQTTRLPRRCCS